MATFLDDPVQSGLLQFGLAMMAGAGPSPHKQSLGSIVGKAGLVGTKAYKDQQEFLDELEQRKIRRKLLEMQTRKIEQDVLNEQQSDEWTGDPNNFFKTITQRTEAPITDGMTGPGNLVETKAQVPLGQNELLMSMLRGPKLIARDAIKALTTPEDSSKRFINVGDGRVFDVKLQKFIESTSPTDRGMNEPTIALQRRRAQLIAEGRSPKDPEVIELTRRIDALGAIPINWQQVGPYGTLTPLPGRAAGGTMPPSPGAAPPDAATRRQATEAQAAENKRTELNNLITEAGAILPYATASGMGSLVDSFLRFFGGSTDSGDAASRLETIGAWMTSNVPRMEGPQGQKDVELYQQMAAKVADRNLSMSERMSALNSLKTIASRAKFGPAMPIRDGQIAPRTGDGPIQIQGDTERDNLPSGTRYIGPDGKERVKR